MTASHRRRRGRPSSVEAEAIRHRILAAATHDFLAHGYASANIGRIARLSGSTKPTIYRIYASKERLFKTAMGTALDEATGRIEDFSQDERPPRQVLTMVAQSMMDSYATGVLPGLWRAVLGARAEFPDLYSQMCELMRRRSIAASLARYFATLERRGVLAVPDPALAAHNFALLVGPASDILGLQPVTHSQDQRIQDVIGLFLRGYAADAATDPCE